MTPAAKTRAFRVLETLSFLHSAIYSALLAGAFGLPPFDAAKQALGWGHGLMWIGMSLLCLAALRAKIISLWLCVAVVVVGGIGPFVGTISFVREDRRKRASNPRSDTA